MKRKSLLLVMALGAIIMHASLASADIKPREAVKIAGKNLPALLNESYREPVQYDSAIAIPVHSRTTRKNDFYLVYLLNKGSFVAEVAVDRITKKASLLSYGKVELPYYFPSSGEFASKYLSLDSMLAEGFRRFHNKPDSARLIYLGVMPSLGRRGVIWEIFVKDEIKYITFGGPSYDLKALYLEANTYQQNLGNHLVDSVFVAEMLGRLSRLNDLTPEARRRLNLTDAKIDSLKGAIIARKDSVYLRFPDIRGKLEPRKPVDSTGTTPGH